MKQQNCWEFTNCGREPGGAKAGELGVCPAAVEALLDGVNRGRCGGRSCWAVAGTFCGKKTQGTYARKLPTCIGCDFYKKVLKEEGNRYTGTLKILKRMKMAGRS